MQDPTRKRRSGEPSHSSLGIALAALWGVVLVWHGIQAMRLVRYRAMFRFQLLLTVFVAIAYLVIRLFVRLRPERLAVILTLVCFGLLACGVVTAAISGVQQQFMGRVVSGFIDVSVVTLFFGSITWAVLRNREEVQSEHAVIRVFGTMNTVLSVVAILILGYLLLMGFGEA